MRSLARWCFTHRRVVVLAWIAALVGVTAIHSAVGSSYSDNFRLPHTQSFDAVRLLERNAPKVSGDVDQIVIAVKQGKVTDTSTRAKTQQLLAEIERLPHVASVASPLRPAGKSQISPSGQIAFANVTFDQQANKVSTAEAKSFVDKVTSASGDGVEFEAGGQVARSGNANNEGSGLAFGFVAAAIVLFLVFGSLLATALPLLTAGLALGTGVGVAGLLSHVLDMASFASELALLIGLGVGVDYALFIVTRYKQALLRGVSGEDAVVEAMDTSGRAVLFAGVIVCIAMLGMFALGVSFLYGVAVAAAIAVAFTVIASMTLLPATLGVFGRFVLRRRERRALREGKLRTSDESVGWARWAGWMSKRPAVFAAVAAAVMIIFAIPFFSMRLGSADSGSDPANTTTRKAYDLLAKGFGPGYNGPLQLVAEVDSASQRATFERVVTAVRHAPGVVGGQPAKFIAGTGGGPDVAIANVYPKGSPQDKSTSDLLHTVRDQVVPSVTRGTGVTVLTGGQTAIFDDFSHILTSKLPLFIGVVVLLSFVLLMAVFRSIAIPATAAVMNLLSAGAAFGVITAIFQNGWGASLLGVDKTGPIESFLPVLMFPILFGLSMDYNVFLVSRIFEEWHRRRDNLQAVTHGLAATGRTISAAAAIMVLVFGAFVLGGERVIKLFGIGLGGAVLLDAAIIRAILVPALMMMLGDLNWKLPRWLDRWIPQLNIEGAAARRSPREDRPGEVIPEPAAG
jgi:putative drug exporter of the RND superfamily